ncbi:M48 family metallopeptidase [Carboxylicivirga linearis]|uniref:M48 family metallopeptidase n=2 Tax=Carboxylicivirga linearis TaxID=1628157 RepID=A0ABS5JU16_9BACT|nr:M48 family metallopeptidase [Carboxylicivirga linearis]
MKEAVVEIPELGQVTIRQSAKAKRISIKLKPFKGVTLVVPVGADIRDGIGFLKEKKDWIQANLKKLEEKEGRLTIFDENTEFKSRSFALQISKHTNSNVRLHLNKGILHIYYPEDVPVTHPGIQENIRYGIEEALRLEAKRFLPRRLAELAEKHSIQYNNVTIKNLKSRWGSCSGRDNINLNLHLMRLPDELIDYVILHELCHVHEKNHGPHFWARLDIMTNGQARQLDGRMKDYQTKIY